MMDKDIASVIVAYLGGPYFACELRATSRIWRELIPRPKRCSPYVLAIRAARVGDMRLCRLAISRGVTCYVKIASRAARGGHREICELAFSRGGYIIANRVIRKAARSGHFDLCVALSELWNVSYKCDIAEGAARAGNMEIMLRNMGQFDSWYRIAGAAARGGHRAICEIAIDHISASCLTRILCDAARGGHPDIYIYVRDIARRIKGCDLTRDEADAMLSAGARGGNRTVCELAIEWGARCYLQMMYQGARGNHRAICEFARELFISARNVPEREFYNSALAMTAWAGHEELCALLCEWGADNFAPAYVTARENGYYELCAQIESYACKVVTLAEFKSNVAEYVLKKDEESRKSHVW